jgi:hypothetical protein
MRPDSRDGRARKPPLGQAGGYERERMERATAAMSPNCAVNRLPHSLTLIATKERLERARRESVLHLQFAESTVRMEFRVSFVEGENQRRAGADDVDFTFARDRRDL